MGAAPARLGEGMAPARVGTSQALEDSVPVSGEAASRACVEHASEFLHGCVSVDELAHGWVRPQRLYAEQRRALESCLAWYPGIYRQMATCCAGVSLELETDATELEVEVRVDAEPRATRKVLEGVSEPVAARPAKGGRAVAFRDAAAARAHDGISAVIDGVRAGVVLSEGEGRGVAASSDEWGPSMTFSLAPADSPANLLQLPGFGDTHHVRLWLPSLRGCELGRIAGNGTFLRPVPARAERLLVLGDSVAQGFVTDDPATSWPALVAGKLACELVNQSVGAQVFQPSALAGLGALEPPTLVVVALGANYRYGRSSAGVVLREATEFIATVERLWPEAGIVVLVPPQAGERAIARGSCYEEVPALVRAAAEAVRARRVAAHHAALAIAEQPALPSKQLSDEDGHPTAEGASVIAGRVLEAVSQLECRCLKDLGAPGRCGACVKSRKRRSRKGEPEDKAELDASNATMQLI